MDGRELGPVGGVPERVPEGVPERVPEGVPERVPGRVPESELSAAVLAELADSAPPPPWKCRAEAVVWAHRTSGEARAVLPEPLRDGGRPRLTVGAFLRYHDSPVGPYAELFGGLVLPHGLLTQHVPFMAVDSLPSLVGGRLHWALPKSVGTFSGHPSRGGLLRADGSDWWLRAQLRAWGPALPAAISVSTVQTWPDHVTRSFRATIKGRARLARVELEVAPQSSLARWLLCGRHLAVQWPSAQVVVRGPADAPSRCSGPW